jgi:hypothetical protein
MLLLSRWTAPADRGQLWNIDPVHDRHWTVLDRAPSPTDKKDRRLKFLTPVEVAIVEVPASHVSFVSQPEAATQLILQAVEATS